MEISTGWMVALGVLVGAIAGVLLHALWAMRHDEPRLRMPEKWPLRARGLVTSEEYEVWRWLRKVFDDHQVLVKVPVSRFTLPLAAEKEKVENDRWLDVLNGVYTTFSVCTNDGRVVGCVDVPGKRGLTKGNRELKETLLMDCSIGYTVVRATHLPTANAMRAAFIGELLDALVEEQDTRGGDSSFHADLDAFTKQKIKTARSAALKELNKDADETAKPAKPVKVATKPGGSGSRKPGGKADRFSGPWHDSFTQPPSDSRPARLE